MAVDHERIARLLGDEPAPSDTSLQAQSLKRATSGIVPKTLTPHEWEQWYAIHGIPDSHLNTTPEQAPSRWRKLLHRLLPT